MTHRCTTNTHSQVHMWQTHLSNVSAAAMIHLSKHSQGSVRSGSHHSADRCFSASHDTLPLTPLSLRLDRMHTHLHTQAHTHTHVGWIHQDATELPRKAACLWCRALIYVCLEAIDYFLLSVCWLVLVILAYCVLEYIQKWQLYLLFLLNFCKEYRILWFPECHTDWLCHGWT